MALVLVYGAYYAEVYRAGIEAVPSGQMEAARSLGMSHGQAMRNVIVPQAVRKVIAPMLNEFTALLKDTTLVSVIALNEVALVGRDIQSKTFNSSALTLGAILFLIVVLPLARVVDRLIARANGARHLARRHADGHAPLARWPAPMLRLEGIFKSFGELEVLRGIDLEIAKGEVVCVLGPSGSGKSTLLRCVNLLEPPEEGDIYLEERSICKGPARAGASRAGSSTSCASGSGSSSSSSTSSPTRRPWRT